MVTTAAGETQDVVETTAGETQKQVSDTAEETQKVVTDASAATNEAIAAVAEELGVTTEEIQKTVEDGDSRVIEIIKGLEDRIDDLPGPLADVLAPYFELVETGVSALTDSQEKSFTELLEAIASQTSGLTQSFAETGLMTVQAVSALKDTISDMATSVYNRFFAPDEPGEAMTADEYAEAVAAGPSIDRTGAGMGGGGSQVIGGAGGGFGAGSRDPVSIADYLSADNDTDTGAGSANIGSTDGDSTGQSNAFTRPVPIANQELFGGYMGQAQRLSGTLNTYPQLQQQASQQYGAQVASQFPSLSQNQQAFFAQYVTDKVQAKAGIGTDPGFLPYDIYNVVAPRLAEVLGDVGYYQYSSGRRIPGFMNYMPAYQDSMFNRQDIGTDPLPGGPAVPPQMI